MVSTWFLPPMGLPSLDPIASQKGRRRQASRRARQEEKALEAALGPLQAAPGDDEAEMEVSYRGYPGHPPFSMGFSITKEHPAIGGTPSCGNLP